MKHINKFLVGVNLINILLFVSCQSKTELTVTAIATEEVIAIAIPEITDVVISTTTAVPETATPFSTPGVNTTVTASPLPTQTTLPTKITTPTPWPTLTSTEAVNKVLALLANNRDPGCLLPCWWGTVPGRTQERVLKPYLASFALEIYSFPEQSALVAKFAVPKNIDYLGELNIGYKIDSSGVVTDISVASININGYDPKTMMGLYGIPNEVWLKTLHAPREEVLPFQLIMIYQDRGIGFHYYVNASTNGKDITVCFEPGVVEIERPELFPAGPRIYLWAPGQRKTVEEIANIPEEKYYPLEEKTDLTPQTFYDKFTASDGTPCIDTPVKLWEGE